MEKLSCPIGVLWELYRRSLGTLSSSVRFLWDLHPVLQGPYGKVILSCNGLMGTLYESYVNPILLYKVPVLSLSFPAGSLLKNYHVI